MPHRVCQWTQQQIKLLHNPEPRAVLLRLLMRPTARHLKPVFHIQMRLPVKAGRPEILLHPAVWASSTPAFKDLRNQETFNWAILRPTEMRVSEWSCDLCMISSAVRPTPDHLNSSGCSGISASKCEELVLCFPVESQDTHQSKGDFFIGNVQVWWVKIKCN